MRFFVVTLALLFIAAMIYLTAADFADNGVTGLGIVGAIVVGIVAIGTIGSFLHPPRRTEEDNPATRPRTPQREEQDWQE
jgi:hypothetical protein